MREIKFRGMDVNGNWHFGLLSESKLGKSHQPEKGFYISNSVGMPWAYNVRPETVGQYTALKDKNGVEIFDGDIVEFNIFPNGNVEKIKDYVYFSSGCFGLKLSTKLLVSNIATHSEIEVIGNIYENPELISK